MKKLWGGAFSQETSGLAEEYGRSIESDLVFWKEDVECSIAHARMLGETGIISKKDSALLVKGLKQILREGKNKLPRDVEDVHTAIEVRLNQVVGDVAGKLHTGRSRNDQVATSTRLHLRKRVTALQKEVKSLQAEILKIATKHRDAVMPGMTHQQHAQPVTLGFHLLAYFWAIQRHGWRLENLLTVTDTCPLGSAALAGTSLPIDRKSTAKRLGFDAPTPNALDATSDRSYVLDALHVCLLVMLDLSRVSQELIVWSMPEFGWVSLPDSLTTGSSIMPQKRNPDMAELIRGRTGTAIGNYVALATTMKGLMSGYNRDYQEDKPSLFGSLSIVESSLPLVRAMLSGSTWNVGRMAGACQNDFSTATDLADALVGQGVAFRKAHHIVGRVVRECERAGIGLESLTSERAKKLGLKLTDKDMEILAPGKSAVKKSSSGGTGKAPVAEQLKAARRLLDAKGFRNCF